MAGPMAHDALFSPRISPRISPCGLLRIPNESVGPTGSRVLPGEVPMRGGAFGPPSRLAKARTCLEWHTNISSLPTPVHDGSVHSHPLCD